MQGRVAARESKKSDAQGRNSSTYQNGLRMAPHSGLLQKMGAYLTMPSPLMGFSGVYRKPIGTAMRFASAPLVGKTFQEWRTPSLFSVSTNSISADEKGEEESASRSRTESACVRGQEQESEC